MDWLCECAVAGGIPDCEAHPLFSRSIEGYAEFMAGERAHAGERDDLAVDRFSIAPDELCEFGWECPFHFGGVCALWSGAFDAPVAEEYFAAGHKIVAGAEHVDYWC